MIEKADVRVSWILAQAVWGPALYSMLSLSVILIAQAIVMCFTRVPCGVTRADYLDDGTAALIARHREQQVPLIVSNLTRDWRAHSSWDQVTFARRFGNLTADLEPQVLRGGQHQHWIKSSKTVGDVIADPSPENIALSHNLVFYISHLSKIATNADVGPWRWGPKNAKSAEPPANPLAAQM